MLKNMFVWHCRPRGSAGWSVDQHFYAPNFEKVGDILVSACPCVSVCVWGIEISS